MPRARPGWRPGPAASAACLAGIRTRSRRRALPSPPGRLGVAEPLEEMLARELAGRDPGRDLVPAEPDLVALRLRRYTERFGEFRHEGAEIEARHPRLESGSESKREPCPMPIVIM